MLHGKTNIIGLWFIWNRLAVSLRLRLQDPIFKTKWEIYDSTQADADRSLSLSLDFIQLQEKTILP